MEEYLKFKKILEKSALKANRDIEDIELVSVSKKKPVSMILDVIASGCTTFGENQLQEVENKWIDIKNKHPEVKLHFIGGIQSKKTNDIFKYCDVIHSIDREKIVKKIKDCEKKFESERVYFIQINTGNESQKAGVLLDDSDSFIDNCINNYQLNVSGLMCIPPVNENPRDHFLRLRDLGKNFNLPYLSMGMSNDFDVAIECGSTHIRIGSSIFGIRD